VGLERYRYPEVSSGSAFALIIYSGGHELLDNGAIKAATCEIVQGRRPVTFLPEASEPRCLKCGKLILQTVVMPSLRRDSEERLFECSSCGHAETVFVTLQPISRSGIPRHDCNIKET
jgi:hypothetical protein